MNTKKGAIVLYKYQEDLFTNKYFMVIITQKPSRPNFFCQFD